MLASTPINTLDELQQHHQLLETTRDLIYDELTTNVPKTIPQSITQEARISNALKRQVKRAQAIANIYKDEKEQMKEIIQRVDCSDVFSNFYEDLEKIRKRHGDTPSIAASLAETKEKLKNEVFEQDISNNNNNSSSSSSNRNIFSGEEHRGRFVDMITLHQEYLNLILSKASTSATTTTTTTTTNINNNDDNETKPISYIEYLENAFFATSLEKTKLQTKNNRPYQRYCNNILTYLKQYIKRIEPIDSVQILYEARMKATTVVVINNNNNNNANTNEKNLPKLSTFKSLQDLEKIDGNILKQMLGLKKMKQGGTINERAKRLWTVKDMEQDEIPKKLLAKIKKKRRRKDNNNNNSTAKNTITTTTNDHKSNNMLLNKEHMIVLLSKTILDRLKSTILYLRRKQIRSYEEILQDLEDEEIQDSMINNGDNNNNNDNDDDDDGIIYNPKNVPLGFDGKPIPYWMYKLHGFDKHFTCEICGNATYTGPRIFEKHFSEGRHSMGMQTLNIPNSKEYYGLTKISEVLALHKKLQKEKNKNSTWNQEEDEEFEDSEGNVMSKETYENLKRNGLL